ncbi:flavodoxin [Atopobacter sp. AH10]|uniref:flavodoxin n=1 Tax=Atopobacter sp. AH10 TaxID=2315861 RepID=UPI000EF1F2EA|nr:flavodoxin [Atopobacter sp. AH10]RLK62875.1 flavodoxin [Atopobacter sp. AH10]
MAKALIIYTSLTGNTEEICDILSDALEEQGIEVEMKNSTQADVEDFNDADICIVGTYTYGDGEIPDEMLDLYEDLEEADLSGKIYGVVGSGDTFYDHFCKAVEDFDERLAQTGAQRGGNVVKVNLNPDDIARQELENLAQELATALKA